jgi:Tol biopolymer transport system component
MKRFFICTLILLSAFAANAQTKTIGIFENTADIGNPKIKGSATYNPASQSYTLKGAGYNIWFERDEFRYLFNKIKGDFILTADFEFSGKGKEAHRKTGWMVRESTDEKSRHITATLHGDGLTVLQWRPEPAASMRDPQDELFAKDSAYNVIQIERQGKTVTMRAAHSGKPFDVIGTHEMASLSDEVLVGPFICSHNADVIEEVRVWNVRIDKPVPDNYSASKMGPVGCRLEIVNISDGKRKVIWEKDGRFEAPNWMPDGKKLLFNMDGLMYTIPVTGGKYVQLNTGSVKNCNNDHGISFDGKWLAISSSKPGVQGGGSAVWVLPLTGGEPKLITEKTPSYWHGWSPNNIDLVYVAIRDGKKVYNIYQNSRLGGDEVQLTDIEAGQHVDGCEYSPDGKYIYYNGNHTGTMQLWRMKPDGTGREQLTFDNYNNWFPHISPDGKWIFFISFPSDIDPNSHPSYKRVMLRLMPVTSGEPKVIVYLYGGQGTINVPSWSPDSKQVAFVSNSGLVEAAKK